MNKMLSGAVLLCLLATLNAHLATALAQGTAFTYQGRLNGGGSPLSGLYDFRFKLFADPLGNTQVGANYFSTNIPVAGGLFVTTIDFGAGMFNGSNYWLEVDVRTNNPANMAGYTQLIPFQALTPAPYAVFAGTASNVSGTIAAAQISGPVSSANLSGTYDNAVMLTNAGNSFSGNGSGLTSLNAAYLTGTVPISALSAAVVTNTESGVTLTGTLNGNGGGLTNLNASQLASIGNTNGAAAGNFFAGPAGNPVTSGSYNTAVGGLAFSNNGTGSYNTANGFAALSANTGGSYNLAAGYGALAENTLGQDNTAEGYAAIASNTNGIRDTGNGYGALYYNTSGSFNTAAGGKALFSNTSGSYNTAAGDSALLSDTTGSNNVALGYYAGSSITSGSSNIDIGNWGLAGDTNIIRIGSGQTAAYLAGVINGNGGGLTNLSAAQFSGGAVPWSELPGFQSSSNYSAVGGGQNNAVTLSADHSVIGGGYNNTIGANDYQGTIAGGYYNTLASGAGYSAIGGGQFNTNSSAEGTIGGGQINLASGQYQSTVGGGYENTASGSYATVPGGFQNVAGGVSSLAAGAHAQAANDGAFVWADDSTSAPFASTNNNSFNIRAAGGVRIATTSAGTVGALLAAGQTSWTTLSDRNAKKNFQPVDYQEVLAKLASVPIQQWNYKWEKDGDVPNLGPMAQDFKHAFFPGRDDKGISTLEFDGVELAAIQGLNQKLEARSRELETENADLRARLEKLEQLVTEKLGSAK
jgi:hypothetical protein